MRNIIEIIASLIIGIVLGFFCGIYFVKNFNLTNSIDQKEIKKVENPYEDKLKIEIEGTGYLSVNVWKPYIEFYVTNISNEEINDYIDFKVDFIDQDNNENLGSPSKTIISGYQSILPNEKRLIQFLPFIGKHGATKKMEEKNVVAKFYLENAYIGETRIENKRIK